MYLKFDINVLASFEHMRKGATRALLWVAYTMRRTPVY